MLFIYGDGDGGRSIGRLLTDAPEPAQCSPESAPLHHKAAKHRSLFAAFALFVLSRAPDFEGELLRVSNHMCTDPSPADEATSLLSVSARCGVDGRFSHIAVLQALSGIDRLYALNCTAYLPGL